MIIKSFHFIFIPLCSSFLVCDTSSYFIWPWAYSWLLMKIVICTMFSKLLDILKLLTHLRFVLWDRLDFPWVIEVTKIFDYLTFRLISGLKAFTYRWLPIISSRTRWLMFRSSHISESILIWPESARTVALHFNYNGRFVHVGLNTRISHRFAHFIHS